MKKRCECKKTAKLFPSMAFWYDKKKELPFVEHKPNKCKCTNELKLYLKDGKKVWLCSNCYMGEELAK